MALFSTPITTRFQKYKNLLAVTLFLTVIATSQAAYDRSAPPFKTKLQAARRDLLPSVLLPYINFGFSLFLADMYWIRTIQDYVAWDNKELFFLDYFKNISTLDPKFEHPYLFAMWTVPSNKNIDRLDNVAVVAQRGIDTIPTSWRIPYDLGTQYYLFTKSYDKAKKYLQLAAEKENAPPGVYLNYSSFVINDIKGYKASYDLVKVIYDATSDETLKKVLRLGMEKEVIITMLERGILAYKTTKGRYPASVEELQKENFVSLSDAFLENFIISINKHTGSFKIEERK
jgi:hypothetical protein